MLHQRLSHPSNGLERTILHSNKNIYNHFIEEKILRELLTIEYSNTYCKKRKHHLYLQSAQFI